jgi:hypothetical protein
MMPSGIPNPNGTHPELQVGRKALTLHIPVIPNC